jgi:hypothetical protein
MELPFAAAPASLLPLTAPDKGCRVLIPVCGNCGQPLTNLLATFRMLPLHGTPLQNTLQGFGHVQSTAAQGRVQRHDAVGAQPEHHLRALMADQVIPHQ